MVLWLPNIHSGSYGYLTHIVVLWLPNTHLHAAHHILPSAPNEASPLIALAIGGAIGLVILITLLIILVTALFKKHGTNTVITEPLYDNGVYESSSQMNSKFAGK